MLRLLRTTSFRFTLVYVLVFTCAVAVLGAFLYSETFGAAARQTDAVIDQEIEVLAGLFANEGAGALRRVIRERAAWRDDGLYMLIAAPTGAILSGNLTALPPEALSADEGFFNFVYERPSVDAAGRETGTEQREARGKIRRFRSSPDADTFFLVFVARDVSGREELRSRLQGLILRVGLATLALGIVVGLVFSRTLLRRVDAVSRTAGAIRGGDLSRRIGVSGTGDELDNLAVNLNAMLDQIERLMTGMREVSDNIAHDLRSPLTRIRNRLTAALEADTLIRDEALKATLDEAEKMIATFNALLSIARIESGEGAGHMEKVDLVGIVEEMAELYEPAAQDAGFSLVVQTSPCPPVQGSRSLISQAIANMLDNALKYATGGKTISIRVGRSQKGAALLSVADDGPGVPEKDREHVLRRFVRLETSRTSPGSGLGLSLVSAIARAHGATLRLGDAGGEEGRNGLKLTLAFPAAEKG